MRPGTIAARGGICGLALLLLTAGSASAVATTTAVNCVPSPVAVGSPASCTASVSSAEPTYPLGSVSFEATGGGSLSANSCTLSGLTGSSRCKVTYTPFVVGPHRITATYAGDAMHESSTGAVDLAAVAAPVTKPKKCKKKKKRSAAAAKKKCRKKRK